MIYSFDCVIQTCCMYNNLRLSTEYKITMDRIQKESILAQHHHERGTLIPPTTIYHLVLASGPWQR